MKRSWWGGRAGREFQMEGTARTMNGDELVWWGTGNVRSLRRLGHKTGHGRRGWSCREDF